MSQCSMYALCAAVPHGRFTTFPRCIGLYASRFLAVVLMMSNLDEKNSIEDV